MPQTSLRFRHVDESVDETLKPDLTSELSFWLEKVGWKLKRGNMECVPRAKGHVCSGPPSSLWMIATEIQPKDRSIIQCVQQPFLKEKDHNPGVTVLANFFPSLLSVEKAPQRFAHPKDRWSSFWFPFQEQSMTNCGWNQRPISTPTVKLQEITKMLSKSRNLLLSEEGNLSYWRKNKFHQ